MKPDLSSLAVSAVAGDPKYLELLFAELFRNSDKFRHPSRPLQISISSESITRNIYRATERKYKFGEFVRIAVSDNGIGFDDTHAELVLQLLQKLGQAEGDGLGLAFCKKIAELHGGEIGIRSQKGDGTVVLITLPV
jgi:sigma-B regulation protein RsbU (phosphoserine phosphatase)